VLGVSCSMSSTSSTHRLVSRNGRSSLRKGAAACIGTLGGEELASDLLERPSGGSCGGWARIRGGLQANPLRWRSRSRAEPGDDVLRPQLPAG